jgi:transcription antitermination factor NusG
MPIVEKNWYAVYTKPRWEKKVHGLLLENGFEAYCPLNKVQKKWSDRLKLVEEPLFKSYVFVRVTETGKPAVRMIRGVVNFVYWMGKPAIVRDQEIATIRKFLDEYRNVKAEALVLAPDAKVKIQRGAFMDKEAKVLKIQGSRVQVVIHSIGYSLVAFIDKSNITMAENR